MSSWNRYIAFFVHVRLICFLISRLKCVNYKLNVIVDEWVLFKTYKNEAEKGNILAG